MLTQRSTSSSLHETAHPLLSVSPVGTVKAHLGPLRRREPFHRPHEKILPFMRGVEPTEPQEIPTASAVPRPAIGDGDTVWRNDGGDLDTQLCPRLVRSSWKNDVVAVALSARNPAPSVEAASPLFAVPGFSVLLGAGLVAVCALIAGFVWKLAREGGRSIQAATGMFYLAVIMALSAEMATKFRFFPCLYLKLVVTVLSPMIF
jgi:hypothetical protein